jgi:tetratricopeptide (TPR) repeat protein
MRLLSYLMLVPLAVLAAVGTRGVAAQSLPFKAEVAGLARFECTVLSRPELPTEEEAAQARQLGGTARQAVILGDLDRARGLLERAVSLDGGSAALVYQFGRVLEDLGDVEAAVLQYCRSLAFGADDADAQDARNRVDTYANATRRRVPPEALASFETGVVAAGEGRFGEALTAFSEAAAAHADFPEAEFNRAVVLEALDRGPQAIEAYRAYLALRPDAPDGIQVSERIGQLQAGPGALPSSGSALALGLLLPGGGQFYTGRPLGGVALLAIAGGAAAAALLVEEVDVRCLRAVEPGQACPPDQVIGETRSRPYLTYGLAGAGAVMLAGALEAFFHARGLDEVEVAGLGSNARLLGPSVQARGRGADVRWLRVVF